MITNSGLTTILKSFVSTSQNAYRIDQIEFGKDVGNGTPNNPQPITKDTPPTQFQRVFSYNVGNIISSDDTTVRLLIKLEDRDIEAGVAFPYTSIRIVTKGGSVLAWTRFPVEMRFRGYETTIEWNLTLGKLCVI